MKLEEIENPELRAAITEACEKQYRGHLYGGGYAKAHSKDIIAGTMEEMQRQREAIEAKVEGIRSHAEQVRREATMRANPYIREITANLKRKYGSVGLVCPVCGEGDHRNRMNGKPVCMMNAKHKGLGPIPLMTLEKAREWKPPEKPKIKSFTFKELDGVVRK